MVVLFPYVCVYIYISRMARYIHAPATMAWGYPSTWDTSIAVLVAAVAALLPVATATKNSNRSNPRKDRHQSSVYIRLTHLKYEYEQLAASIS